MPEGPETHYDADRLAEMLVGEPLLGLDSARPELARKRSQLLGRKIERVEAHGKALLTRFEHGWTLYTHNHLFGYWKLSDDPGAFAADSRPRIQLRSARGAVALYAAPSVQLLRDEALAAHPYLAKLGPDVLDPCVDAATMEAQLCDRRFAGRSLAALLLDPRFAAGMGNYLRAEVLYEARLAPLRKPAGLDRAELRRLARALIDIPRRRYRAKFGDGRRLPAGKDYLARTKPGFRFRVFDREGEPCPRCGGTVANQRIGGRRLFWCPACQR